MDGLIASHAAKVAIGILIIAALPVLARLLRRGPTRSERYAEYLAHYRRRHDAWCGAAEQPPRSVRVFDAVVKSHSLLRLAYKAEWDPMPPPSLGRSVLVLLALVQACAAAATLLFVPPIRSALPGASSASSSSSSASSSSSSSDESGSGLFLLPQDATATAGMLRPSDLPATLIATCVCILLHLLLRFGLESSLHKRVMILFRRPDSSGRTEGHLVARAALTHFDERHTLRSCLQICARLGLHHTSHTTRSPPHGRLSLSLYTPTGRYNLWEMEQLIALMKRMRYSRALEMYAAAAAA